jgi:uroporphyrinogen decarboxylase
MDFPAAAINWSHATTGPTLKEGMEKSGKAVMGGIDETTAAYVSVPEMRSQVAETISVIGRRGIVIAPGCSVPTDTPERTLRAIKEAVERAK